MSITQEAKKQLIGDYRVHENDTGSSYVQVAILTKRIENITKHLKVFKKDTHCKYGLSKLVVRRRKLLNYIKSYEVTEYHNLIKKLGIRK